MTTLPDGWRHWSRPPGPDWCEVYTDGASYVRWDEAQGTVIVTVRIVTETGQAWNFVDRMFQRPSPDEITIFLKQLPGHAGQAFREDTT